MRCLSDKKSNFSVIVEIDQLKGARDQLNTWICQELACILKKRESLGEDGDEFMGLWPDSKSENSNKEKKKKKPLSSENTLKLLKCKYQILESNLKIIESALNSLEISAEYAQKIKEQIKTQQYARDLENMRENYISSKIQQMVNSDDRIFQNIEEACAP